MYRCTYTTAPTVRTRHEEANQTLDMVLIVVCLWQAALLRPSLRPSCTTQMIICAACHAEEVAVQLRKRRCTGSAQASLHEPDEGLLPHGNLLTNVDMLCTMQVKFKGYAASLPMLLA